MATRGELTEAKVLAAFLELGLSVFLPWRSDAAYDLVVSVDQETFLRVQCKSGRVDVAA